MKTITIRDLRYHFPMVETLLAEQEEILITKRRRPVGRLLPPNVPPPKARKPDFLARLKRIYGNKILRVSGAELLAEERARY